MPRSTTRPTAARDDLLLAARYELANGAYEQVGLRQVAARAGIDTAKLVREFGSKEQLLIEVMDAVLPGSSMRLAPTWVDDFAGELTGAARPDLTEPFRILAFSAPSPAVEGIVRARVHALLGPLEGALDGGEARGVRAALAAAVIFGVILSRDVIGLEPPGGRQICAPFVVELLSSLRSSGAERKPRGGPPAAPAEPRPFGVAETKAAILEAADRAFSELGYEHASVRRIAADAGIDPALIVRYFGSKEELFQEVLRLHFAGPARPDVALSTALAALADLKDGGAPLDITLRSAPSPIARKILKQDIETRFLSRLAEYGDDDKADVRALTHSAVFMGASFCHSILRVPALHESRGEALERLTALLTLTWTTKAW